MRDEIVLGTPVRVGRDRMVVPVNGTGSASQFVVSDLWAEFDVDLSGVPDGILTMPALMTVLPLAWLENLTVRAAVADSSFVSILPDLKRAWRDILWGPPELGGELVVDELDRVEREPVPDRALCLFTGGIDSTSTALRHMDEDLVLVTAWGADGSDPRLERPWRRFRSQVSRFATERGWDTSFVRTNYREFIDTKRIDRLHPDPFPYWWRGVHGLVQLSLVAPIAVARSAETVYIASGRTPDFESAPGSLPEVDDVLRYGRATIVHDGFGNRRSDKQRLIAREAPDATVNVCYTGSILGGANCRRCEKCLRTTITFFTVGADPSRHGLAPRNRTFRRLRRSLERGTFSLINGNQLGFWRDLQDAIPAIPDTGYSSVDAFLRWFATADVDELRARSVGRPRFWRGLRARASRLIPRRLMPLARRVYLAVFRRW